MREDTTNNNKFNDFLNKQISEADVEILVASSSLYIETFCYN